VLLACWLLAKLLKDSMNWKSRKEKRDFLADDMKKKKLALLTSGGNTNIECDFIDPSLIIRSRYYRLALPRQADPLEIIH